MGGPGNIDSATESGSGRDEGRVHVPVLLQETIELLGVRSGGVYVDGTVGGGGHAESILEASTPGGRLLGLDRDPRALRIAGERLAKFGDRAALRHGSFARLSALTSGFESADGLLLDLGLSSMQLADPDRGFAFSREGPLDMRFNPEGGDSTAADLVNGLSVNELVEILYHYGEERQARRIAQAIVEARPLESTGELARLVADTVGGRQRRIHPATRVFQALRIAVNDELAALEQVLPQAVDLLREGGRLVVISFHSLEDRIVKHFIRQEARDCICPTQILECACDHRARLKVLTSRPVRPGEEEVAANPRARSARLRAAEVV